MFQIERTEVGAVFFDPDTRRIQMDGRLESLQRDFGSRPSALRRRRRGVAAALRLPFAAAELEPAPRTLPRAVPPLHRCSAAPAGFRRHASRI